MTSTTINTALPTIQALGTLEVLSHNSTLLWETAKQGEFSLWNLLRSQGFVKPTDLELAFEHWQNIERWGTATDQKKYDYEYAPFRDERRNDSEPEDWNEAIATQRQAMYTQIQQWLSNHCQLVHAYKLSAPRSYHHQCEWSHPHFEVSIVVAELQSEQPSSQPSSQSSSQWLCLAPTTPDELYGYERKQIHQQEPESGDRPCFASNSLTDSNAAINPTIIQSLSELIESLHPIEIYGYYHGGYNSNYPHRIMGAIGSSPSAAVGHALRQTGMVIVEPPALEAGVQSNSANSPTFRQFMNQCLRDRTRYILSFWDIGFEYEGGYTAGNDWIGCQSMSEFEYNP